MPAPVYVLKFSFFHPHLLNSSSGSGDNITSDPFGNDSLPTDALQHADPVENPEPNEPNSSNN
jgi:hypothetical protein